MKVFKKLLIPIIVMAVLVIAVIVWAVTKTNNDNAEPVSEAVVALSLYEVKEFEVTTVATGESIGFTAEFDENSNQTWSLLGDQDDSTLEVDQDKVTSYVSILCNFMSKDLVAENPTDLAQYGLSPAQYEISLTTKDGTVTKILMGNRLASGSYAYFMVEGDTKVYTVAAIKYSYCEYQLIDFVSSQILDLQYPSISNVRFIRTTDDLDVTATCNFLTEESGATYHFTSPMNVDSSNVFSKMVDNIVQLKVAKFVELSDEEIKLYGLENPAYTFIFTLNDGEQITVQFSDVCENEMYYGKSSTTDQYFMVSNQQVNGFDSPVMSLIDEWVCYEMISEISEISAEYNDQNWTLSIDVPNSITDPDAKVDLDMRNAMIKTPDGNRTYSAILYESVACISIGGIDFEATPDVADSAMTIKIRDKNYTTTTYDFVPRTSDTYYVMRNEEYTSFYINDEEILGYGGTNTYTYGVWPAYWLLNEAIENQSNGTYDINDFVAKYEAQS